MEAFFFFFSIRSLQPSRNISISYCSHVPVAALLFFLYICSSSRLQDTLRSKTTLRMCCICMCQKWFARVSREGIQETWPAKQGGGRGRAVCRPNHKTDPPSLHCFNANKIQDSKQRQCFVVVLFNILNNCSV